MRNAFAAELYDLAASDERVCLLSGDIGNQLFDQFKQAFPDRFINCGVAEANMIGVAAGMAMCGLRPIAYTIAPFVTIRCLEQIRVDVCYHSQPVVLVGVGGGLSYAELGATHLACEDVGVLRLLPGMTVICPGDPVEVRLALRASLSHDGPVYLRLGKRGEPIVHNSVPSFRIGKGITVREGEDVCLLNAGNLLPTALDAAEVLLARGVSARVVSYHTVKPLDEALLEDVFGKYPLVVTVEEHSRLGGLGSAVAEWLAEHPQKRGRLMRIGTPDSFPHVAGNQHYSRHRLGLTPEDIAERILVAITSG